MIQRCENCGRPLLKSDVNCIHCGTPVPGRESTLPVTEENGPDLKAAARYGAVLIGLVVLGALLYNWMGAGITARSDVLPTTAAPAGWSEFRPADSQYRIWLPEDWQTLSPKDPDWETALSESNHPVPLVFRSVEPTEWVDRATLLAKSPSPAGETPLVLTVQLHPGLAATNLESLQSGNWTAGGRQLDASGGTSLFNRPSGETALIAELVYPIAGSVDLHTLSMLVEAERGVYAVTVSAEADSFLENEETLWAILGSFQPLD